MSENKMTGNIFYFVKREAKAAAVVAGMKPKTESAAQQRLEQTRKLVERVRAGDKEAFGELYKMFAPLVHGIILARVSIDEVQDLAQEVFLLAYKNLHTLREPGAVGAWLAMIARNRAAEFYRSARQTEELPEDLSCPDDRQTEAREILTAIRALPEAYKETLILRLVEGMTGPEIAERTNLTPESVRVNLHRGMKLLRKKLSIEDKQ